MLNRRAMAETVATLSPEAIIVATGARIETVRPPGSDLPHVLTGTLLRQVLSGEIEPAEAQRLKIWERWAVRYGLRPTTRWLTPTLMRRASAIWMPIGRKVAILGGDLAAIELAEFLAKRGRRVALLSEGSQLAPEIGPKRRAEHMDRLDQLGAVVNTDIAFRRIDPEAVVIEAAGVERSVRAQTVILAGEARPDLSLYESLTGLAPELFAVGDCTGLGLIRQATEQAMRAACSI